MPKKTCKTLRPKELVKWMSPRDLSLALKWNQDYQEDLKILRSIPPLDRDLVRRQQALDIQERMKSFGLWPPCENFEVPAAKAVPYRRISAQKGNPIYSYKGEADFSYIRDKRFTLVEIDLTAKNSTIHQELDEIINSLKKKRATPSKKQDHWDVYARVHDPINPQNCYSLAQEKCGKRVATNYDPEMNKSYAKYRRAEQKAKKLVLQAYSR